MLFLVNTVELLSRKRQQADTDGAATVRIRAHIPALNRSREQANAQHANRRNGAVTVKQRTPMLAPFRSLRLLSKRLQAFSPTS